MPKKTYQGINKVSTQTVDMRRTPLRWIPSLLYTNIVLVLVVLVVLLTVHSTDASVTDATMV